MVDFKFPFVEIVRSFHRKPAILRDEGTAVLWPMPLPYPAELISTNSARTNSFRRGVNLTVAALNWLHLRRPRTCPAEIVLFRKLTKLQWKVVRFIESALTAWDVSEPITATGMGRAASKVEDIEILLARLSSFETGLDSVMEELGTRNSNDLGQKSFSSFAPGLQAESAGELVGQLPGRQLSVAKTIEADRIDFRGTPEFDAAPFLDPLGRALYLDPVSQAIRPEDSLVEPPPVKIFASETEKWKLLRKLDASGRLGVILEGEIYQGYQAGLFSIQKDGSKDRLIFDSRPFNTLEQVPQRWIKSMASAATLCELQLGKDEIYLVSGTDLREFYYSFRATHSRLVRNSLLVTVWPWELRGFKCYQPALERQRRKVYLGLRTLAMGDSAAVELAQTAHVGLLAQSGLLSFENLLCMELPPPRSVSMVGVVIDDLVLFERLVVSQLDSGVKPQTEAMLQKAISRYTDLGLIPHSGKTFALKEEEEFWGCLFEGRRGMVRASLKRVIPILFATLGVLKLGVTTLQLLEVLTGCWVSIFLFKRRLLSLLNTCYTALGSGEDRRSVLRLSDALRDELLLCCMLAPLAVTCLKAENADFVYASDASDWGYAVVRAPLRGWMRGELHRHRLQKSTWVRLLSPYKAHLRRRGDLDAAEELPGGKPLSSHPLWSKLASCLQFDTVVKRQLRENIHINVGELNGMVAAEREAVRDKFPVRCFDLADSQVALGVWIKGRSSSIALNQVLQQSLAVHCGCGVISNGGYVASAENPADDPTRHVPIRQPVSPLPSWYPGEDPDATEEEEKLKFDAWLRDKCAEPIQLSGLPDLLELHPLLDGESQWTKKSRLVQFRQAQKAKKFCGQNLDTTKNSLTDNIVREKDVPKPVQFVPSAALFGRRVLSPQAHNVLRKVPRSQFIFPSSWAISADWVPDFAGYLDLYSGVKGVAKAVARSGRLWSITFELEGGDFQDVLSPQNVLLIRDLLQHRCVECLGAAIFCCSFSRAVRPAVRSRLYPDGLPHMSIRMHLKVTLGNQHSLQLHEFIKICIQTGIYFWVENPDGSFLWLQKHWQELGAGNYDRCLRLDYCSCGTAWRKRTRFFTDLQLAGQHVFCTRTHSHRRLVGYSRLHKCSWTRVAQAYPRRLCQWISSAILSDTGAVERRRADVAALAKLTPGRIGEAGNPGPRRSALKLRPPGLLQKTLLVEPATELLGIKTWESFKRWGSRQMNPESFERLICCDMILGELLEQFGFYLFDSGQSIYLFRQLLTFVQRQKPQIRTCLGKAWQVVSKWAIVEPTNHRTPLPVAIYFAMVATALGLGWRRWAGIVTLAFEGITRPGEALRAFRTDLLLPRDLIFESDDAVYLQIRSPKGRRRGLGTIQHAKILGYAIAQFLDRVFGGLKADEALYPAAPASFRRRWDFILSLLKIPTSIGLTPASLRAGGAIRAYRQNEDLGRLMWRMRLKQAETLQHYLQEVAAISILGELPEVSQRRIFAAGSLYKLYLDK